ncbi:MAG: serine/threonine protein kinase [Myxococcales bacterium]|nr:serine/threonine protein kinase [Myxococcales bacterium]
MDTTLADPSRTLLPPTPPVPASSLPLATAGLRLGPTLGEGGLGVIQLAHQDLLGRDVAVKRLKRGSTTDALARLLHEARMMGCLEHPNVPPVHAVGVDPEGTPVLVMKRVDGDVWRPGGDLEDDVRVLIAVTDALLHAHERGVVHRDLKPANVMRGAHGVVYLVDWGAAWPAGDTAEVAGTPAFMAPEMYAVGPAAPSMDTWARSFSRASSASDFEPHPPTPTR